MKFAFAKPLLSSHAWMPWLAICGGLLFSVTLLNKTEPGTFFSGDGGLKFLQVMQWARGGADRWRLDLVLPADPWVKELWDSGLYPLAPPFVIPREGRQYVNYPPFFSWMSAPFHHWFGFRGLYVVPLLALLSIWLSFIAACRRAGLTPLSTGAGLLAVAVASPLTIYAATFWEHTLGIALAFPAVARLIAPPRRTTGLADGWRGFLLGLSAWFRPELMLLTGMLAGLVFILRGMTATTRQRFAFVVATAAAMGSALIYNFFTSGSIVGLRGLQLGARPAFIEPEKAADVLVWTATKFARLYPLACFVMLLAITRIVRAETRASFMRRDAVLLAVFAVHLVVLTIVFPDRGGNEWGPRYHLMLVPALALLMVKWMSAAEPGRLRGAAVVAWMAAMAIGGYQNMWHGSAELRHAFADRIAPLLQAVRQWPSTTVAVNNQRVVMELAVTTNDKRYFLVEKPEKFCRLVAALRARGQPDFLLAFVDPRGRRPPEIPIPDEYGGGRVRLQAIMGGWLSLFEAHIEPK